MKIIRTLVLASALAFGAVAMAAPAGASLVTGGGALPTIPKPSSPAPDVVSPVVFCKYNPGACTRGGVIINPCKFTPKGCPPAKDPKPGTPGTPGTPGDQTGEPKDPTTPRPTTPRPTTPPPTGIDQPIKAKVAFAG